VLEGKTGGSSSSADPTSSSAANTNSSAAPSSDGSMLRQNWPSQSHELAQVSYIETECIIIHYCIFLLCYNVWYGTFLDDETMKFSVIENSVDCDGTFVAPLVPVQ
jgi:hypothetical protein